MNNHLSDFFKALALYASFEKPLTIQIGDTITGELERFPSNLPFTGTIVQIDPHTNYVNQRLTFSGKVTVWIRTDIVKHCAGIVADILPDGNNTNSLKITQINGK